ncbi:MAG TPA: hypothetical protein VL383_13605 [Gemmatimonadaceae bacterium]|nr:hypothetical protein [Gemmatimonadaceae bacterium]
MRSLLTVANAPAATWVVSVPEMKVATTSTPFPDNVIVAAPGFRPLAVSVAVAVSPTTEGAYWTVTSHDFPLPSAVPVQASDVIEKFAEPVSETLS